jgi:kynurenine formamidase
LKNGIQHATRKLVSRGVLLDIARYKGVPRLDAGYPITPADLEGAASKQGVTFRPGDILVIRTGWITIFREKGKAAFEAGEPGIGWAASQWLKKQRVAAVAADNEFVEVLPAEPDAARKAGQPGFDKPIHYELIRNQGMPIGELFQLEELAEACASDGTYEFLLVAQPMKLINATGSPINPLAIK